MHCHRTQRPTTCIAIDIHCMQASLPCCGLRAHEAIMRCKPCGQHVNHACVHAELLAGLPVIPSELSEPKERDVVLVLHHCHIGVMNARSCAKRMRAAYCLNSGAKFSHGIFNGDWRQPVGSPRCACLACLAHAGCIPGCDPGVRREPSRSVSHSFRES